MTKSERIPGEIAFVVLTDELDHAINDGPVNVTIEPSVDRNGLRLAVTGIGSPAAEDVLRNPWPLAGNFKHAVGSATGTAFLEGNIGFGDIIVGRPLFRATGSRIFFCSGRFSSMASFARGVDHGRHIHFRRHSGHSGRRHWHTARCLRLETWLHTLARKRLWLADRLGFRWLCLFD